MPEIKKMTEEEVIKFIPPRHRTERDYYKVEINGAWYYGLRKTEAPSKKRKTVKVYSN